MQSRTVWLINQYASTPETGMGGRHYYLAKELAKQGHNVYVIAASYTHLLRKPPEMRKRFRICEYEGIKFVWIKMPVYRDAHDKKRVLGWFLFSYRLLALPNIIPQKPDAILASSPSPVIFLAAIRLARRLRARLVFEVRDIWPLSLVELGGYSVFNPFVLFLQWIEDMAYRKADVVVSNLPNSWRHMVTRGMAKEKFVWVPNGFDLDEANDKQALDEDILALIPRDRFIVGYVGTIGVANALESLLQSAERMRADRSVAFVIVGEGKLKQNLVDRVVSLGLDNVTFIQAIDKKQVQTMLQLFDVCYIGHAKAALHKFGVSPNKLFEYFYAARPIIYAIDSGEYLPVSNADAGISVAAEDCTAIVDAIRKLQSLSAAERARLGRNAREYALQNYEYSRLGVRFGEALFGRNPGDLSG